MERVRILDTTIDNVTMREVGDRLSQFLDGDRPRLIVTANPEIVLRAHREAEYRRVLDTADLVVPDGVGLLWAARLLGHSLRGRVTGIDVIEKLLSHAETRGFGVFVAVNKQGLVKFDEVKKAAVRHHPHLNMSGMDAWGGESVGDTDAQIIMCNFGSPEQELWLSEHRAAFPKARVLVGVGGALDFLAGRVRRAPSILRQLGVEWLWRLVLQPWRLPRIIDAVIVFPLTTMIHKPHGET